MEAEDRRAEHAVEHLLAPGQDAEGLGVRPRNVPEGDDGGAWQALAHHARQEREVVVLHQDDRVLGVRLVGDDLGEAAVHLLVVLPVGRAEHRPRMRDMAERPEAFVGEAVVVALLFFRRQPYAAYAVCRPLRRHHHVVVLVDCLAIGRARAVRDPGAGAGAHDRLERRHQAARRALDLDHVVLALDVHVGLAVRDDQHLVAFQILSQDSAQRLRPPGGLALIAPGALGLEVAHQRLQVARDRSQLRRRAREPQWAPQ